MPLDVTMCPADGCPFKARCYRARAVPLDRQDWFGRTPFDARTSTCDQLWDIAAFEPAEAAIRDRAYFLWLASGRVEGQADAHWREARAALEDAAGARLVA
ncbi:MAG: DUF2934 domain-containing protein [Deltaproteobacteria bacterium]